MVAIDPRAKGVSTPPVVIAFTRTPRSATSSATDRVRPTTACLAATYGAASGSATTPMFDALFTIAPPVSRTAGIWYLRQWKTLVTFCVSSAFHVSASTVEIGPDALTPPALLNAPSRRPNSATAAVTSRAASSSIVTSAGTKIAVPPAVRRLSAAASPTSLRRLPMTTAAPSAVRRRATANPMPDDPPVTMKALFSRRADMR